MEVHFDFAAQKVSIHGDGPELYEVLKVARDLAPSLSNINIVTSPGQNEGHRDKPDTPDTPPAPAGNGGTQTLREFVRSLSLSSAMERIVAIAYYQKYQEGRDRFSPKEMAEWFSHCGLQKPSQMPVALFDTRRKRGYVENVGRGAWRITTQGENLIVGKLERQAQQTK